MKKKTIVLCGSILLSITAIAQLKINKQLYIDMLNRGEYSALYDSMRSIQKKPFGKCCLTDYFIAKSLCLSNFTKQANNRYSVILTNYKLTPPIKQFIEDEKQHCDPGTTAINTQDPFTYINNYTLPTSSVNGKLGIVYRCAQSYAPVKIIQSISEDEMNSRVFSPGDSVKALAKINGIIPADCKAEIKGNFIIVTQKGLQVPTAVKKQIAGELQRTMNFYHSFFDLTAPGKLITVYMVPDNTALRQIAEKVHGVEIPKENYGYSMLSDLSLMGISNAIGIGTLKHELFHLVVRADFGDIPAWLDEGIATLYEESHWSQDTLLGNLDFWRTRPLREALSTGMQLYYKLPDMQTLLDYSWAQFDGSEEQDICKAYINYAFAKHIVVWLQQTGQLRKVLDAYRYKISDYKTELVQSNAAIFSKALGMSIDDAEAQFAEWLKKTYGLSLYDPRFHGPSSVQSLPKFKKQLRQAKSMAAKMRESNESAAADIEKVISKAEINFNDLGRQMDAEISTRSGDDIDMVLFKYADKMQALQQQFENDLRRFTQQ